MAGPVTKLRRWLNTTNDMLRNLIITLFSGLFLWLLPAVFTPRQIRTPHMLPKDSHRRHVSNRRHARTVPLKTCTYTYDLSLYSNFPYAAPSVTYHERLYNITEKNTSSKVGSHMEAGSNTSTVALRVVGGDVKWTLESEAVKYDRQSQGTAVARTSSNCKRQTRPLVREGAPHINKPATLWQK
jgi:hypothetical protein